MKRLLLLGLLLIPVDGFAAARVLVIDQGRLSNTDIATAEGGASHDRFGRITRSIMKTWGISYESIRGDGLVTEDARTGILVRNRGKAGQFAETFDGVVHIGPVLGTQSVASGVTAYRPDSILKAIRPPLTPSLFLFNDRTFFTGGAKFNDAACCTSGVSESQDQDVPMSFQPGKNRAWVYGGAYLASVKLNSTAPSFGGVRRLISTSLASWPGRPFLNGINCAWCDSLYSTATDSAVVWERPFTGLGSADGTVYPAVMAFADGAGGALDTLSNLDNSVNSRPNAEVDPIVIMAGLARLDSIMRAAGRGDLITKPLQIAITIDGGFTHTGNRLNGFYVSDSSVLKGSIDSVWTNFPWLPLTLGVQPDSVRAYPNEKGWWGSLGRLRYTPQSWIGVRVDTSASNSGNASRNFLVDIFGRYHNRIAVGDGSGAGKDTSIASLLSRAFWRCDSIWGRDNVSRFVLAPDDDWSPRNAYPLNTAGPSVDSVLYAIHMAGAVGVRVATKNNESMMGSNSAPANINPRGFINTQGSYREKIGGHDMKLIGMPGHSITGGSRQIVTFNDSVPPFTLSFYYPITTELCRAWTALTQDRDFVNYDAFPYDYQQWGASAANIEPWLDVVIPKADLHAVPRRSNIVRFHAGDFSGDPNGPPARNGWWILKSIVNASLAINDLAGRPVIQFVYPEDVRLNP